MILKSIFGAAFIIAGICHFLFTNVYIRIMPAMLPEPILLVRLSGVCELLLGSLLLVPRWSALAAWGLIALLIAVFPANIQMALHASEFSRIPAWLLWLRLPLQGVLIAWAWKYTRR